MERDGIRCTSLARTVVDLARTAAPEAALAVADAALALVGGDPWEFDDTAAQALLTDLADRVRRPRLRGHRAGPSDRGPGRRARAASAGERDAGTGSISSASAGPRLQVPVDGPRGGRFWMDIAVDQSRTFVECDGRDKYLDEGLRGGRPVSQVVLDEKIREDWCAGPPAGGWSG
ncbi:hypothetical protein AB1285_21355 [Microbacterium sp. NRRL B-14842]|uniref:hypothetical protein n=1 Tax=Microbacterium sp. NRRL B-14842 TaxID=3162881 RepID=UPI003D27824E